MFYSNCNFPRRPLQKRVFLECGCNPQNAIFEINNGIVQNNQIFLLDRVFIDTTGFFRPQIKIDFSSLIMFEGEDEETYEPEVEVELLFKLERICNGVRECVQTWTYQKEFDVEDENESARLELKIEISEPFTVTFCDRDCPGCCEYRMLVEGIKFEGEFEYLRVVKPNLSAIVQVLGHDHC